MPSNYFFALDHAHFAEGLKALSVLCGQPIQQQGRRIPPRILDTALAIRTPRVFSCLPDITQHTHSLRASGVILSHNACTLGTAVMAFRRSVGNVCGMGVAASFLLILIHK